MGSYIVRRLLLVPFLLVGIATLTFIVSHTIPADPLATLVSERQLGNPEVVRAAQEQWGLDKSVPEQYVVYLGNLAQGDMGISFRTRRPVVDDLTQRMPATCATTALGVDAGAKIFRVHDVWQTRQAINLWQATL